jgi:hypothetical protein
MSVEDGAHARGIQPDILLFYTTLLGQPFQLVRIVYEHACNPSSKSRLRKGCSGDGQVPAVPLLDIESMVGVNVL